VSAETVRIVNELQSILVGRDVVEALDDARLDRELREVFARLAEPDFEVLMVGPAYTPAVREGRGVDGFDAAWRDWTEAFESFHIEVEEMIDAGDAVVSLVRQHGTTKIGGVDVDSRGAAVWTVRDGKLARVEFHIDHETALRSAGVER
jgi:ketosteroid isomerase-like protein